jgi:hypothetical protein
MKIYVHLWWYLTEFFLELEIFHTEAVDQIKKKHFMFNNFFQKLCSLWDYVQKHGRTKQATDGNMTHMLCMLDN